MRAQASAQASQAEIEAPIGTVPSFKNHLAQITAVEAAEKKAAEFFVGEIVAIDFEEKERTKAILKIFGILKQLERPKENSPRTSDELRQLFLKLQHEIYPEFESNQIFLPSLDWAQVFEDEKSDPIGILNIFIDCCKLELEAVKKQADNKRPSAATGPALFSSPKASRAENVSGASKCENLIRVIRDNYLAGLEKLGNHATSIQKMNISILKGGKSEDIKRSVLDFSSTPSNTLNCLFLMGMEDIIDSLIGRKYAENENYTVSTNEETLAFACLRGINFIDQAKLLDAKPSSVSEKILALIDDPEITAAARDEDLIMRNILEDALSQLAENEELPLVQGHAGLK